MPKRVNDSLAMMTRRPWECSKCPARFSTEREAATHETTVGHPGEPEKIGGSVGSGYTPCACRDCFDTAIGDPGNALCHECRAAGCSNDGDEECKRLDAYGVGEEEGDES